MLLSLNNPQVHVCLYVCVSVSPLAFQVVTLQKLYLVFFFIWNQYVSWEPQWFVRDDTACQSHSRCQDLQAVSELEATSRDLQVWVKFFVHTHLDSVPSASSDLPVTAGQSGSLKDPYQWQDCRVMSMSSVGKSMFNNSFTAITDHLNETWVSHTNIFITEPRKC